MPELSDRQSAEIQGSGTKPYIITNTGGVYSCTCPVWRNQSAKDSAGLKQGVGSLTAVR